MLKMFRFDQKLFFFFLRRYRGEKFMGVSESVCLGEGNNKSDFNLDIGNSMSTMIPRLCWL